MALSSMSNLEEDKYFKIYSAKTWKEKPAINKSQDRSSSESHERV